MREVSIFPLESLVHCVWVQRVHAYVAMAMFLYQSTTCSDPPQKAVAFLFITQWPFIHSSSKWACVWKQRPGLNRVKSRGKSRTKPTIIAEPHRMTQHPSLRSCHSRGFMGGEELHHKTMTALVPGGRLIPRSQQWREQPPHRAPHSEYPQLLMGV